MLNTIPVARSIGESGGGEGRGGGGETISRVSYIGGACACMLDPSVLCAYLEAVS